MICARRSFQIFVMLDFFSVLTAEKMVVLMSHMWMPLLDT